MHLKISWFQAETKKICLVSKLNFETLRCPQMKWKSGQCRISLSRRTYYCFVKLNKDHVLIAHVSHWCVLGRSKRTSFLLLVFLCNWLARLHKMREFPVTSSHSLIKWTNSSSEKYPLKMLTDEWFPQLLPRIIIFSVMQHSSVFFGHTCQWVV